MAQTAAAPSEAEQTASFTKAMFDAAIAEGERRVYERLGIPQPAPERTRHLAAVNDGWVERQLAALAAEAGDPPF